MTAAPRRVFVDTNVLIYASRAAGPFSQAANDALEIAEEAGDELCISRQILREYLASVTRPQIAAPPMAAVEAVADVRRLGEIYTILEDGPVVTERLYELLCGRRPAASRCTMPISPRPCWPTASPTCSPSTVPISVASRA